MVGVCTGCDVLTERAYSALLSKWCFSTSSFEGDVKLSVPRVCYTLVSHSLKKGFLITNKIHGIYMHNTFILNDAPQNKNN